MKGVTTERCTRVRRGRQSRWLAEPAGPWFWLGVIGLAACAGAELLSFPEYRPEAAQEYLASVASNLLAQVKPGVETSFLLARLQAQLGQQDRAEQFARDALALDPKRPDILSFVANLLIREDRLEEAGHCLSQAVEMDPKLEGGYRRLGMIRDRLGDSAAARSAFERAMEAAPRDATARLLLGRLLLDRGDAKAALAPLERACQLDPELANAFYVLAQAQDQTGQRAEAQQARQVFLRLKEKEKATLTRQNATRDDAQQMRLLTAAFHNEAATLLLRQQRADLAELHLRQAMLVAPDGPAAFELLSGLYQERGDLTNACAVCQLLVSHHLRNVDFRVKYSLLLLQLRQYASAVRELNEVLRLDPNHPAGLNNLARLYLMLREQLPEALTLARRLVEVEPTAANYDLLARACYANGQPADARKALAQAVALDPNNATYRERLRRLAPEKP